MKSLADELGIEHNLPEVRRPVTEIIPVETTAGQDQDEDYKLSRKTFRSLITKGSTAIEDMTDLARESESPRAYEVLATLIKTVSDTTKDLYDLQKKTKDLKDDRKDEPTINVEKAVFVGNPADMLKRIKEQTNEDVKYSFDKELDD